MWRIFPTRSERQRDIHRLFDLALFLKAINGGLEIVSAALALIVPPALVLQIAEFLTAGEIAQDPDDPLAIALQTAAQSLAVHTPYFFAFYLTLHGLLKVALVVGIFMGKRIAYPLFMIALALFGTYEAYRGLLRHELLLQILAAFDFSLLALTAYEYRRRYPRWPANGADTAKRY